MSSPERERAEASFEQFRSLVGPLEIFYQEKLRGVNVYVNGNGQVIGLPVNGLATALFEHALVGDVVICKDGMYSDGLSGEALDRVMTAIDAVPDQTLRLYSASGEPVFVKVRRKRNGSDGTIAVMAEPGRKGYPAPILDRTEPCHCGSGKRYKNCCRKAGR